jgi:proteic killer suppression protein
LKDLFERGVTAKIEAMIQPSALLILDHLDAITSLEDCRGVKDFHALKGRRKGQYSMHVSGNWCITFTFADGKVAVLNLEDYH